jgi:integrase
MPHPRLPYLQKEISRHGSIVWYVRTGAGPRTRVRGEYGSPEFMASYQASLDGVPVPQKHGAAPQGTLGWLIARYRESGAWAGFSPATRRQRDNIFLRAIETAGRDCFADITKTTIRGAIDRRKGSPFAARDFLKATRGLFRWAVENGHVDVDPTDGVRAAVPRTDGYHTWTEDEIARFEARWPIGTRERLALSVLLYTGLRRGDAAMLGRQHIRDGVITIRTAKTGKQIIIPVLPWLAAVIDASPTGDLAFIATTQGQPMTTDAFGQWFVRACRAAGVPGSAHGLRKAGATRAANDGATVAQLNAIFGWSGSKMAGLYTEKADRVRLARDAMGKLAPPEQKTTPYPRTLTPKPPHLGKNLVKTRRKNGQ